MDIYDEEMLYHAKRISALCNNRYSCHNCPMLYRNILTDNKPRCLLTDGMRPDLWILPGDYADAINKNKKG